MNALVSPAVSTAIRAALERVIASEDDAASCAVAAWMRSGASEIIEREVVGALYKALCNSGASTDEAVTKAAQFGGCGLPPGMAQLSACMRREPRDGVGLLDGMAVNADAFDFRCDLQILADTVWSTLGACSSCPATTHCVVCRAMGLTELVTSGQRFCGDHVMSATKYYDTLVARLESAENPTFREAITNGPGYPSDDTTAREAWNKLVLESLKYVPRCSDGERRRVVVLQDKADGRVLAETVNLIVLDDKELVVRYEKKRLRNNLDKARVVSTADVDDMVRVAKTHRRSLFGQFSHC
jgi:hypothetical protein